MQPGLQEWIHKLEEGEGVRHLKTAFAVLLLLALSALWHIREAKGFGSVEAMDSAQLARNIAEGEGYTTSFVRPLSIALVEKVRGEGVPVLAPGHPDIANPPVYPVLLAGLMKVLPFSWEIRGAQFWRYQPEILIGLFNQLLFFAALFLVYRLGRALFDPTAGKLAVLLLAGTELMWSFTTSGLSTMLLIVLILLLAWVLVVVEARVREGTATPKWIFGMAAVLGLLLGTMALTRYSVAFLALPAAIFLAVAGGAHRVKLALIPPLIMLLMFTPWLARNYSVSERMLGTAGFSIYQGTTHFGGNRLERSMPRDVRLELNRVEVDEYPRKLAVNSADILSNDLPRLGGSWVAAFFLVALVIPFRNPGIARFRYFVAGSLALLVVVQALGKTALSDLSPQLNSENLLVLMAPLVFLFGAGLFLVLLDQLEFPHPLVRGGAIALFVVIVSLPLILRVLPPKTLPFQYPPYHPPTIQHMANWMKKDELLMSDVPWAVAWYGGRQAVWTTLDSGNVPRSDFFRISDYQKEIKGLYLTQLTMDAKFVSDILKAEEGAWGRFVLESILKTNVPAGFPLRRAPPGFFPEQLFLSDQRRWN